jgi:hypothetical protein
MGERKFLSRMATSIALAVGIIAAALTLSLYSALMGSAGRVLPTVLFPGILGSAAVAGNAHAFSLGIGAAINFVLYLGITWVICKALAGVGKKLRH